MPHSSVSLLLGFSAILSVSLVSRLMCLGVKRHLASGYEMSRLQHGLQLIMARYTRRINCRPCCNLYLLICLVLSGGAKRCWMVYQFLFTCRAGMLAVS